MSMSTRIEDLPGPIFDEIVRSGSVEPIAHQTQKYDQNQIRYEDLRDMEHLTNTNIKTSLDSKDEKLKEEPPAESKGFFGRLIENVKSIFNEDNLILWSLFVLASLSFLNSYITKVPFVGVYAQNNDMILSVLKGFVLLVVYVLLRSSIYT